MSTPPQPPPGRRITPSAILHGVAAFIILACAGAIAFLSLSKTPGVPFGIGLFIALSAAASGLGVLYMAIQKTKAPR